MQIPATAKALILAASLLAIAVLPAAQSSQPESFDTSGMPRRPTTFVEQQILEMIGAHRQGDLSDAVRIQRKLGRYYADKGDDIRANAAFLRAASADKPVTDQPNRGKEPLQKPIDRNSKPEAVIPDRAPATAVSLVGNYFGMDGRTLHTWEFHADGTFLHTWIVSGAGTNVRNSERGSWRMMGGGALELRIQSAATGFTTPGQRSNTTMVGGGSESASETRTVKLRYEENAIVLDGIKLKPKSW